MKIQLRLATPEDRPLRCNGRPSPHSNAQCEMPAHVHWNTCPAQDIHAGRTRAGYWKVWPVTRLCQKSS